MSFFGLPQDGDRFFYLNIYSMSQIIRKIIIKTLISSVIFFSMFVFGYTYAQQNRDLQWVDIVSRAMRWADETWRQADSSGYKSIIDARKKDEEYMVQLKEENFNKRLAVKAQRYEASKKSSSLDNYLLDNYPTEFEVNSKIPTLWGYDLRRPLAYHNNKNAIIIHHTADEAPSDVSVYDEIQEIQRIYKFHAFTRWRWDIWYNFIIWPSGKIYEGRAGWPWVIWAHCMYNNSFSVWISLMWNFEVQEPSDAQIESLIKLSAAISKKYQIDPYDYNTYFAWITASIRKNFAIVGHRDAGVTACPGKNLYDKLDYIRAQVAKLVDMDSVRLEKYKKLLNPTFARTVMQKEKKQYMASNNFKIATVKINKINTAPKFADVSKLIKIPVQVLLRDLSLNYDSYDIYCVDCNVYLNGSKTPSPTIWKWRYKRINLTKSNNNLYITVWSNKSRLDSIRIVANGNTQIRFSNYNRFSFAGIPRNVFNSEIDIYKDRISENGKESEKIIVKNVLSLDDYMAGVAETNDQELFEKNKVMALIAKNYMLYYIDKTNKHPSIPVLANYNAIDDPDYFQKFVWAGLQNTLKLRPVALAFTHDEFVVWDDKIVVLPYFSYSAGFTRSAEEKRWRADTPYLVSRLDFFVCSDFNGHGVGLSGKWANVLAQSKVWYKNIIKYYYSGVEILKKS